MAVLTGQWSILMSRATVRAELANAEWVPWIALLPGACTNIDKNGDKHIRTRMYQLVISQPDRTSHGMWGQLAELDQGSCSCKHTHSHRGSVSAQYEGLIKTQIIGKQRGGVNVCVCGYVYFKEMLAYSERQNMRTNTNNGVPWGVRRKSRNVL